MSDYTLAVSWSGKDALSDSDSAKVISGDDFDSEFTTIRTAVNSKADIASPTLTGTPAAPTATTGTNTTQVATTAFVQTELGTITAAVVNALVYPVGSIYTATVSTNPNTLLGMGTWVAFGAGRVMAGFDSGDEAYNVNGFEGGAATVDAGTSGSTTLSTSQMPAHTHTHDRTDSGGGAHKLSGAGGDSGGTWTSSSTGGGAGHTHTTPSHSLLQPYIVVYIWKRTA